MENSISANVPGRQETLKKYISIILFIVMVFTCAAEKTIDTVLGVR